MQYRTLGRTGLQVSQIGYGTWGMGSWSGTDDQEALRALQKAIDLGVNSIDTALAYGKDGHSEQLIGQVLRQNPDRQIYVASKVPPLNGQWPARRKTPVKDVFPASHIIKSTEHSLRNLQRDTLDLQQFHVWNDRWTQQGDWLEAIQKLKEQGKIRFFGISINDHQPENALKLIKSGLVDTVQVIYNIFEQSPAEHLFPLCQQHNIGVIVRVPLDEGGLTGKITPETTFDPQDFRADYFRGQRKQQVYTRAQHIASDLHIPLNELPGIALRFTMSHPAVSTVIPGMRTVHNVERNCTPANEVSLPAETLHILEKHRWLRSRRQLLRHYLHIYNF